MMEKNKTLEENLSIQPIVIKWLLELEEEVTTDQETNITNL